MPRYLITSGLHYINGVKQLGNLVGWQLPAGVYARFLRLRGEEVLYVCGTDEHGTPAELAAATANEEVSEYCRRQHEVQKRLGSAFDLSFDHFRRSSSKQNRELTQAIAKRLEENGYLEEREVRQLYSPAELVRPAPRRPFSPPEVLFGKIDEKRIEAWKKRFGG